MEARQQLAAAEAHIRTLETTKANTPQQPAAEPDNSGPIVWVNGLSTWTGGDDLLGIVLRGKIGAAPVELTDAYIISAVTGEKKVLQVGIAPGPVLEAISDINQIPPDATLELWATFPSPEFHSLILQLTGQVSAFMPNMRVSNMTGFLTRNLSVDF